jgi:hypothetical protein
MPELTEGRLGGKHSGQLRQGTGGAKAERSMAEELRRQGRTEGDLQPRRKRDPDKLAIAARLFEVGLRRVTVLGCRSV